MSIISSGARNLSESSTSRSLPYTSDNLSKYNFQQDLDLGAPHGSRDAWRYQVTSNNDDSEVDPLQRLASAEPQHLPWSGIHLNGIPSSQIPKEQGHQSSSNPMTPRLAQQRSMIGSQANETDAGYYTLSQPDLRSTCSVNSSQMYQVRSGQPSIPRTIPSTQRLSGPEPYHANQFSQDTDYAPVNPSEQQDSSLAFPDPLRCAERGCSVVSKTRSDFKYAFHATKASSTDTI